MSDTSEPERRRGLGTALESREPGRRPFGEYRNFIRDHYDGPAGAFTAVTGFLTGHEALAGRLIRPEGFDVRGCKRILDAACGNGRYSKFLLRHADPDAVVTAFDLSLQMLVRARGRLGKSPRGQGVSFAVADLMCLPYAAGAFDAVVCGWALEHLPNPEPGLRELARVLRPGGKFLLLVTEDTLTGAMCSRLWHCRTHNREKLREVCARCGLGWEREMWFSKVHRMLKLGGIIVELRREENEPPRHRGTEKTKERKE